MTHSNTRKRPIRRRTLLGAGISAVAVSFIPRISAAEDMLDPADPAASALGYAEDATAVDTVKYPQRAGDAGKNQFCDTCALYTGADGEQSGPCNIFPGKTVAAKGWCVAFAAKP